jgi:hypothetical protein
MKTDMLNRETVFPSGVEWRHFSCIFVDNHMPGIVPAPAKL